MTWAVVVATVLHTLHIAAVLHTITVATVFTMVIVTAMVTPVVIKTMVATRTTIMRPVFIRPLASEVFFLPHMAGRRISENRRRGKNRS